ncbi:hypothetical protein EVAR_102067_1 [Eumeta japonica]|uniref:Uncharacterized protein n=1 Tax=Eumeta variegata TaxID=151549 RepID=A0A4C1TZP7_EUMVA|nr:hypothetical protein EVAR_102067_1 [Eumeta japonica]
MKWMFFEIPNHADWICYIFLFGHFRIDSGVICNYWPFGYIKAAQPYARGPRRGPRTSFEWPAAATGNKLLESLPLHLKLVLVDVF